MLHIHFMQQWFTLSDPAMEGALDDTPLYRGFVGLDVGVEHLPDESAILRFRHPLEGHGLAAKIFAIVDTLVAVKGLLPQTGTAVDATPIAAPSSTENKEGARNPEMHQTKKGNQRHFGMKAHIGVDVDSGLVHTLTTTAANAHDVTEAANFLHGEETDVFADSGYRGPEKRAEVKQQHPAATWYVAVTPGRRRALDKARELSALINALERLKASIRSKAGHPFRVLTRQFGHSKIKYRGLGKNTANLQTLFALVNLWLGRKRILQVLRRRVRPMHTARAPKARQ